MIAPNQPSFVIIGAGGISRAYAQAFMQQVQAPLLAVADIRMDAAAEVAAMANAVPFQNVDQMLDAVCPEAAIVCTPPSTHPDICVHLMERGIHVLCEKPLAITSADAVRMADTAARSGTVFSMGSKFRFVADVQKAAELIAAGTIGDPILFENTFAGYVDMSRRWNSDPKISGGGVLIDNGTHSVDILRFLLGPIAELQVVEGRRVQNLPVEDTVHLFARTRSGAMGSIDLSWSMNKVQPFFISVYGSAGSLFVGWKESRYQIAGSQEPVIFGRGYDKVGAFASQIRNFAGAIRGTEELIINAVDAIASVRVVETAYAALRSEKWHAVPSVSDIAHTASPEKTRSGGSTSTSNL